MNNPENFGSGMLRFFESFYLMQPAGPLSPDAQRVMLATLVVVGDETRDLALGSLAHEHQMQFTGSPEMPPYNRQTTHSDVQRAAFAAITARGWRERRAMRLWDNLLQAA